MLISMAAGNEWTSVETKGAVKPSGRHGHSTVVHEGVLYVYGGCTAADGGISAQLWALNLTSKHWSLLSLPDSTYGAGGRCNLVHPHGQQQVPPQKVPLAVVVGPMSTYFENCFIVGKKTRKEERKTTAIELKANDLTRSSSACCALRWRRAATRPCWSRTRCTSSSATTASTAT